MGKSCTVPVRVLLLGRSKYEVDFTIVPGRRSARQPVSGQRNYMLATLILLAATSASATRFSSQPHAVPVTADGTSSEGYISVPVQERVPLLNAVVRRRVVWTATFCCVAYVQGVVQAMVKRSRRRRYTSLVEEVEEIKRGNITRAALDATFKAMGVVMPPACTETPKAPDGAPYKKLIFDLSHLHLGSVAAEKLKNLIQEKYGHYTDDDGSSHTHGFELGDMVMIRGMGRQQAEKLAEGAGGWVESMANHLGSHGIVVRARANQVLVVSTGRDRAHEHWWAPQALSLVERGVQ